MPRGFQQIGRLAKAAMPSQPPSESTEQPPKTSQLNSVTTGSQNRAVTGSRPIGPPHGAIGSASTSISTVPDLGLAMAGDDPLQTDRVVEALLPPRVRYSLTPRYVYPKDDAGGYRLAAYTLNEQLKPEDIAAALTTLDLASRPASKADIVFLLARLKAMTASAAQSQEEMNAQMAFYADELLRYPADVVRHVLKTQPNRREFWPTWRELAVRLESACRERRLIQAVLQSQPARRRSQGG